MNQTIYYKPLKSRSTAIVLALLLGGLGIHKFYLGQPGLGVLYFFFCWTLVPGLISLIEAFIMLFMSDEKFNEKFNPVSPLAASGTP